MFPRTELLSQPYKAVCVVQGGKASSWALIKCNCPDKGQQDKNKVNSKEVMQKTIRIMSSPGLSQHPEH